MFGRRRGVRRRAARRRDARARRLHRRGPRPVDADARPHRGERPRQVAVRPRHEGAQGQGRARPQGALRARRRRPQQGAGLQGEGGGGRAARPRPDQNPRSDDHEPSNASAARAPLREAKSTGDAIANARWFEWLARAGLVARGAIYGIIGVLALELAFGARRQDDQPAGRAGASSRSSPCGKIAARPHGDRPLRLRVLAPRCAPPSATARRRATTAMERFKGLDSGIAYASLFVTCRGDPARLRQRRLGQPGQGDRRRARMARRPGHRRDRRPRPDRRRPLPGLRGREEEVPREVQDRAR